MKKLFIILACVAAATTAGAQMIALHNGGETQIFKGNTAFAEAYTASQSGDTLYFSGGTYFPPAAINKQLKLFGAGHYQDATLVTGKSIISGNLILQTGADNFHIEGFQITGKLEASTNHSITGLICKRNRITDRIIFTGNQATPSSNIAIIGSVFAGGDFQYASEVLVSNCIISNAHLANSHGNSINNNLIFFGFSSYSIPVFSASNNNYIANNVIHRTGSYTNHISNGDGNQFHNNVFSHASPALGNNSTTSNNQYGVNIDDLFINQSDIAFDYSHDYHLKNPTQHLGTDGTQVGIYGGVFPYKEGAVPINPHIIENKTAATTGDDGKLQVNIKVKSQKDRD